MAMTPEELQVLQRIEHQLKDMPFYVVEYIRSKKRAGLSADTLLQYLYRYQHFSPVAAPGRPYRGGGYVCYPLFHIGRTEEAGRRTLH